MAKCFPRSQRLPRQLSRLVLALLTCQIVGATFAQKPPEPDLEDLVLLWESQRTEIASASIRYRVFNAAFIFAPLSPDQVRLALKDYDLVSSPDDLKALVNRLVAEPPFYGQQQPWSVCQFYLDGARTRTQGGDWIDVFDGDARVTRNVPNQVVAVQRPEESRLHRVTLSDFRFIPGVNITADALEVRGSEGDTSILAIATDPLRWKGDGDPQLFYVDVATGAIRRRITRYRGRTLYRERFQDGLDIYPGNIVFPRVTITATYSIGDETLQSLRVLIVEEARFNQPIDERVFAVAVPSGTTVRDLRGSAERIISHSPPAEDVKDLLDRGTVIDSSTNGTRRVRGGFVLILGVLLVLCSVVLWRRNVRTSAVGY